MDQNKVQSLQQLEETILNAMRLISHLESSQIITYRYLLDGVLFRQVQLERSVNYPD